MESLCTFRIQIFRTPNLIPGQREFDMASLIQGTAIHVLPSILWMIDSQPPRRAAPAATEGQHLLVPSCVLPFESPTTKLTSTSNSPSYPRFRLQSLRKTCLGRILRDRDVRQAVQTMGETVRDAWKSTIYTRISQRMEERNIY